MENKKRLGKEVYKIRKEDLAIWTGVRNYEERCTKAENINPELFVSEEYYLNCQVRKMGLVAYNALVLGIPGSLAIKGLVSLLVK